MYGEHNLFESLSLHGIRRLDWSEEFIVFSCSDIVVISLSESINGVTASLVSTNFSESECSCLIISASKLLDFSSRDSI